jgi:hypothetical protein
MAHHLNFVFYLVYEINDDYLHKWLYIFYDFDLKQWFSNKKSQVGELAADGVQSVVNV